MITIKQGEKVLPVIFLDALGVYIYINHWWENNKLSSCLDGKITFKGIHPYVSTELTITCNLAQKEEIEIDLLSGYYICTIEIQNKTFNEKVHII